LFGGKVFGGKVIWGKGVWGNAVVPKLGILGINRYLSSNHGGYTLSCLIKFAGAIRVLYYGIEFQLVGDKPI
jgi:hypothetical protein